MFESISSGKPTIVIKTYENQKFAINFFSKKNTIVYGGSIKKINTNLIIKFFNQLFKANMLKKIFYKNSKLIDGIGFKRIKKIFIDSINY